MVFEAIAKEFSCSAGRDFFWPIFWLRRLTLSSGHVFWPIHLAMTTGNQVSPRATRTFLSLKPHQKMTAEFQRAALNFVSFYQTQCLAKLNQDFDSTH